MSNYLNYSGRDDILSGGVKMIPVETPKGTFRVWTKQIGNHPTHDKMGQASQLIFS